MRDLLEPGARGSGEVVDRPDQSTGARTASGLLPLWLTEAEAEWLVSLCVASRSYLGQVEERALFGKLGTYLREFRRAAGPEAPADVAA